jgi:hypothetical protein
VKRGGEEKEKRKDGGREAGTGQEGKKEEK